MNKAVKNTLIYRVIFLLTGSLITFSIPLSLSLEEQGLYFTFASVLAVQVFFELGLSQVLQIKFANLSSSFYTDNKNEYKKFDEENKKVKKLLLIGRIYYRFLSFLFFIFTVMVGMVFFHGFQNSSIPVLAIWTVLVFITSLNLLNNVKLTFVEGIGKIEIISKIRLIANLLGFIIFFSFNFLGFGLWVVIAIPLANALFFTYWLYLHDDANIYRKNRENYKIDFSEAFRIWKNDIFSMQWRISVSWICGYFVFNLLVPIVFRTFGPEEAGRIGFSYNILFVINSITCTFCVAQTPLFSNLYSNKNIKRLNYLFKKSFIKSVFATISMLILILISLSLLQIYFPFFNDRFSNSFQLLIISLSSFLFSISLCLSVYLRCQGKEPLLKINILIAVIKLPVLIIFSKISLNYLLLGNLMSDFIGIIGILNIFNNNVKYLSKKYKKI